MPPDQDWIPGNVMCHVGPAHGDWPCRNIFAANEVNQEEKDKEDLPSPRYL